VRKSETDALQDGVVGSAYASVLPGGCETASAYVFSVVEGDYASPRVWRFERIGSPALPTNGRVSTPSSCRWTDNPATSISNYFQSCASDAAEGSALRDQGAAGGGAEQGVPRRGRSPGVREGDSRDSPA